MMIYAICLVVGLVFTLVSVVVGHFFGGHGDHVGGSGGHAEAGADSSDMPGISIFSPTIIASFITAFGGFGLIFSEFPATSNGDLSAPLSMFCAMADCGRAVCVSCARCSATRKVPANRASAGWPARTASVVTPIPENGVGEIAYVVSGHALHGAGAHGKRRGHRQRQAGQNHARRRHTILRPSSH